MCRVLMTPFKTNRSTAASDVAVHGRLVSGTLVGFSGVIFGLLTMDSLLANEGSGLLLPAIQCSLEQV